MMMQYQSLLNLLQDVTDPNKVNQVQDQINYRSSDPRFMHLLHIAITDSSLPLQPKLTASVVLGQAIRNQNYSQQQTLTLLTDIITNEQVPIRIKEAVEQIYVNLLQLSSEEQFKTVLFRAIAEVQKMPKMHHQQLTPQAYQSATQQMRAALLIIKCLNNSNAHFALLSAVFMDSLLENILNVQYPHSVRGINSIIDVLKMVKELLQRAQLQTTDAHTELMKWLSRNQQLTEWIFQIYRTDCLPMVQSYINKESAFDHNHMNQLKSAAANLHHLILRGIDRSKQTQVEELTNRHCSQIGTILNTIALHANTPNDTTYDDFVTALLTLTILMVKLYPKELAHLYHNTLHMLVFPLLATTQPQMQLFQDDPTEFNNLSEDCCDKQAYVVLKTEAARLLETVCDQYKNVGEYAVQHAIISLKVRLGFDPNFSPDTQHFLTIQLALFVLSILSYRLGKYPKQLKELSKVLVVQKFTERATPLDLCRLFLFMAYNYQQIFPESKQGQPWIYLALDTSIHQSSKYPTLSHTALDFISNVILTYFSEEFALNFMRQAPLASDQVQFKILTKMLAKHYLSFSDTGLCQALDTLYRAAMGDAGRYQRHEKSHTMDIGQACHIYRKIAQKKQIMSGKPTVRVKIWQLIGQLKYFNKLHLDDQIVKILIAMVKSEGITQQVQQFLPVVMELYNLGGYCQTPYIVFVNEVIVRVSHPGQLLASVIQATKQLIMAVRDMPTSVTDKLALGNSLLVLQHVLAILGQQLDGQIIGKISQIGYMIAPPTDQPQNTTEPILIARALNLIFLCHMHHKDDSALSRMLQFQQSCIFRSHDLKVLTICLTKQLFRDTDIVAVTEMVNMLIKAIWYSHPGNSAPSIKSKRNNVTLKRPTVIKIKKIVDYQLALKNMTQPFSTDAIPELLLKEALQKMKFSNHLLLNSIMRSFPKQHETKLREILSQVTIEGQTRQIRHVGVVKNSVKVEGLPQRPNKRQAQLYEQSSDQDLSQDEMAGQKIRRKKLKQQHCIEQQ